jgi:threonyl-tRNA synthetase
MVREEKTIEQALSYFQDKNQPFKIELINELAQKGHQEVTFYTIGNFTDLCRGGHVESTSEIKADAFDLDRIAGAYWHGDEKNPMLTRIYGLAFESKEELTEYKTMILEAKKRDHKKLGVDLDLFTFSDLVGPGLPLWTPKGTVLRNILDDYVWQLRKNKGYEKVLIPHITKKDLYETSGHWRKFKDELFKIESREGHEFAMKPMNCPHHTQIFNHIPRSYRDMPQRYAETTMVYRDEQSGELSGLSRTRSITQDDAHVFCRTTQVKQEMLNIWEIINTFYGRFGFELKVRLSLHDPKNMANYLGNEETWQKAESDIRDIATQKGVKFEEAIGEAAFYGPKVDFMAKDSLGRQWQVATIQLDMNMPEAFDLFCINEQGEKERIVMIHAAIMGSIERFLSIIIEHFAGAFPAWLAPVQALVVPVADTYNDYAQKLADQLKRAGLRVSIDFNNESVGRKIRDGELQKVPYMLVVGEKEQGSGKLSVRKHKDSETRELTIEQLVTEINQ